MGATAHGRPTVEEFEALPEPEAERWELIDGEVVVRPAPAGGHGAAVARLVAAVVLWAREHGAEVADAPHRLAAHRGYGEPIVVEAGETLTSPLLPGFVVAVAEVLGGGGSEEGASSG